MSRYKREIGRDILSRSYRYRMRDVKQNGEIQGESQ